MGYLAAVTLRDGWRAGAITVIGVTVGLLTCLLASIGGLAELLAAEPVLLQFLRWLGVAYFVWLALDAWRNAGRPLQTDHPPRSQLFARGFVLNLLNPKAALLYVALLPGFLRPAAGSMALQALVLGLIHIAVSAAVHVAIVFAVAGGGGMLKRQRNGPAIAFAQRLSAVLLIGVAGWVALG